MKRNGLVSISIPLVGLLVLLGCAQLGLEQPRSFSERVAYSHSTINGVITATTDSLNAGAIKSADAEYVRDAAVRIRMLLVAAETAYSDGDVSTAEGRLTLASGVLRELQNYLRIKK